MFISHPDTCKITCKEKGTHGIVAVVTEFNFGALGIGVESMEKRGVAFLKVRSTLAFVQHDIAFNMILRQL